MSLGIKPTIWFTTRRFGFRSRSVPLRPSLALVSSSACWTCCGWVMSTWRRVRRGEQVLCSSLAPSPDRSNTVANTWKPRVSRCFAAAFPKPESQPAGTQGQTYYQRFVSINKNLYFLETDDWCVSLGLRFLVLPVQSGTRNSHIHCSVGFSHRLFQVSKYIYIWGRCVLQRGRYVTTIQMKPMIFSFYSRHTRAFSTTTENPGQEETGHHPTTKSPEKKWSKMFLKSREISAYFTA